MSKIKEDRGAFLGALFARMNGHPSAREIERDVIELRRAARGLDGLAIKACNYGLQARDEKRRHSLKERVRTVAGLYNLDVTTAGDPRGWVVKLWKRGEANIEGAAGDAFGGGWGVY